MAEAAVAVILRGDPPELLLIERAHRPGDPWSGHVALPGGRKDAGDASSAETAVRETREELGLDLRAARRIGALSPILATTHSRRRPMAIDPWLFEIEGAPPMHPGPEVARSFWAPLCALADPERRVRIRRPFLGRRWSFGAIRFEEQVIWGLTLRMLEELLAIARVG
jgi:8-oxo-dGTP pyrophosphatase MutT (NUDIX family)